LFGFFSLNFVNVNVVPSARDRKVEQLLTVETKISKERKQGNMHKIEETIDIPKIAPIENL
jgi:hypothetical protein